VTDWLARALDAVGGEAAAAALVADLVHVPSVTGTPVEHELQDTLATVLRTGGLDVDEWAVPVADLAAEPGFPGVEVDRSAAGGAAHGVVARLPGAGDGPTLMLAAHVDVVPPGDLGAWRRPDPYEGAFVGGRVVGRGACDMKGGLASALLAVEALRETAVPLRGDVLVACVEGEEDGGLGMFATLRRGWRADACVIPEPTGLDVVPAAAGALTFRLTVRGAATHASRRTAGVSAVEKFLPVFLALRRLERRRNADPDLLMRRWEPAYPIEIGTVTAGDWPSSVPDLLVAAGRLGVALDEPVAAARQDLEEAVAEACARDAWLRDHPAEVEWWGGQFAPGRTPADQAVTAAVHRAHRAVAGRAAGSWGAPYGSDLRLLVSEGVPTVHYGPGDVTLAHGPDESVPVAEVVAAARVLTATAVEVCGLA
jgi:acetylornithine deacetylase